jgi:heavy metal sensor kinase
MNGWWRSRSLRFRLAGWYAVVGTLLVSVFSILLHGFAARRLALSPPLRQDLALIQAQLAVTPDRRILWEGHEVPAHDSWPADAPYFELWDGDGRLVRRFWPFDEKRLARVPAAPARGAETLAVFAIAPDISLRMLATPYAGPQPDWMIRVMRRHEPTADALEVFGRIIFLLLPLTVLLLVTGGYLITRHWLKPLELMARQAENITVENLAHRLPPGPADDELGRLAATFNRTLGRLEDSFRTLDRFVADASHELRTPLTTLRSVGEVGLRRSRTVEEYREIIGSMLEEANRLHQLVERLLELAGTEGGAKTAHFEWFPLADFLEVCVDELGILAEYKNQRLVIESANGRVRADPVLLRQAVQNLIDNAMKYSPVGTTIRIAVAHAGGECRISVADEGPGIPAEHLARLADRFHRVEDSRERGPGGFGLGLAITKAYLRVMGGRLEYAPGNPRGACFTLVLPDSGDVATGQ